MSDAAVIQRPLMPNGRLYHSPIGLYEFQADAVIEAIHYGNRIGIVDTGLGKTHITMCLAATLFEEGEIDLVMHVGRRNKVTEKEEFPADWAQFTSLKVLLYHGAGRHNRLAKQGVPDVLLTTYETAAAELMKRFKKDPSKSGKGSRLDGPLFEKLDLRNKRVLWIFDEVARLRGRSAERYQSIFYTLDQLRRGPHRQRALGLTATVISTGDEGAFNVARLIVPEGMPNVTTYEREFTRGRDEYNHYVYRKDKQPEFDRMFQEVSFRQRIDDPQIAKQMPKLWVDTKHIDLLPEHKALYEAVGSLYGDDPDELTTEQRVRMSEALKLTAGHPAALLHSNSELGRAIVATLGEEYLRSIPSTKSKWLTEELEVLVTGQGAQVIIFTWWAGTVLPELARDLHGAGYEVAVYSGDRSDVQNREAKEAFKSGRARVLLSSDAGAEGFNLPEATYVIEYEPATAADVRQQRFGRHRRLVGGEHEHIYGWTMITRATIEVAQFATVMQRLERQDDLYGDTDAVGHTNARDEKKRLRRRT